MLLLLAVTLSSLVSSAVSPQARDWLVRKPTVRAKKLDAGAFRGVPQRQQCTGGCVLPRPLRTCCCLTEALPAWPQAPTTLTTGPNGGLTLSNELIAREFFADATAGAFCTVDLRHLVSPFTYFRAMAPEANATLNGTGYEIGGCVVNPGAGTSGRPEFSSPSYRANLTANASSFQYKNHSAGPVAALFEWRHDLSSQRGFLAPNVSWPPKGLHLIVNYVPPIDTAGLDLSGVVVAVHYEVYDGLPVDCAEICDGAIFRNYNAVSPLST